MSLTAWFFELEQEPELIMEQDGFNETISWGVISVVKITVIKSNT